MIGSIREQVWRQRASSEGIIHLSSSSQAHQFYFTTRPDHGKAWFKVKTVFDSKLGRSDYKTDNTGVKLRKISHIGSNFGHN